MTKEQIQTYLKNHPEKRKRSFIPEIVEELTGVEKEKQIAVKVAIRRLQEEIPNDTYGEVKEKAWRKERGMQSGLEIAEELVAEKNGYKTVKYNGQLMWVKV